MNVSLLLGPAGSGKTYRCLREARERLSGSPEGPPLLWVAPKQATYQIEQQLLDGSTIQGYTRLHIVSFERLADLIFEKLGRPSPGLLDEEGRVMVLRALLARKRKALRLFRASARLTGFAQQLSEILRELQASEHTAETLRQLSSQFAARTSLALKLEDLSVLLEEYTAWLNTHDLQDADSLLPKATDLLLRNAPPERASPQSQVAFPHSNLQFSPAALWLDGFAELSAQELELLAAVAARCGQATLTFCLDPSAPAGISWLSNWSVTKRFFEKCRERLSQVAGAELVIETLQRAPGKSRFAQNRVLRHLEEHWGDVQPWPPASAPDAVACQKELAETLRIVTCPDPEGEATVAAREILRHVRRGGRYREVSVLARNLASYHRELQRVFARFEIPHFLDQREAVTHHPLAELTRSALRTVALGWQHEDWFAGLKTGLMPVAEEAIDRLENEALARGWRGAAWQQPLRIREPGRSAPESEALRRLESELEALRQTIIPPFQKLAITFKTLDNKPSGTQLASALREFWEAMDVPRQLEALASPGTGDTTSRHEPVWNQMNSWLENIELAFSEDRLPLREWLPILEAGLANLTVGLIPPALDQVLIGAIDRSRNPDIKLALVLGMNDGVFPAPPELGGLLTESDRVELEKRNALSPSSARQQLSRERYYAYIACTRARDRLVLTAAARDPNGKLLHLSPFMGLLRQLFPGLPPEPAALAPTWTDCEHPSEAIEVLLRDHAAAEPSVLPAGLESWPALAQIVGRLRSFDSAPGDDTLAPGIAEQLYGPVLRSSVSRLEEFAACPFKFFVHSGMRAEERKQFELDVREQGSFQHDLLALFHEQLHKEQKAWRDITPEEARALIAKLAQAVMASYREGLLQATEQTRFMTRVLTESLQVFVETVVRWMREQYRFEPAQVELPFGPDEASPAWSIDLSGSRKLALYGRIDRVDLLRRPDTEEAYCVVVDYKSSQKQLDPVLMANGLQLQLMAYLNVLRHWPDPAKKFGAKRLIPAGVFYVNLRGRITPEAHRADALGADPEARTSAYRHSGRFDAQMLPYLDSRPKATQGDQFNYRRTKSGQLHKGSREPMETAAFMALLDQVEQNLRRMGEQIFAGAAEVSPYRKGSLKACDRCVYQAICRLDPATQRYRELRAEEKARGEGNGNSEI